MSSNSSPPSDVVTDAGMIDLLCALGIPAGSYVLLDGPLEAIDLPAEIREQWHEVANAGDRNGERGIEYNSKHPYEIVATILGDDYDDPEDTWVVCRAQIKAWKPKTAG